MRAPSPGRCSSARPTCHACSPRSPAASLRRPSPRRARATSLPRHDMAEIGETLRDARMRARIDVSEIEAKTKIRAKYLRALENEEWGLLPGPTFVKSFLRTYADALGVDGKDLVEQYGLGEEDPGVAALEPIVSRPDRGRTRGSSSGRGGGGRSPSRGPARGCLAVVGVGAL